MAVAETQTEAVDPRVRRTRLMLQDALDKLLKEKDFDKISVQDIVDKATLHRATFYDHYADKSALLECLVAARFWELLTKRGVTVISCDGALRKVALGVCDYITSMPGASCGEQRHLEGHMESAVIAVVRGMVLDGLKQHPPTEMESELVAATVSWAIYGAAKEWARMPNKCSVERIVEKIDTLVSPMFQSKQ